MIIIEDQEKRSLSIEASARLAEAYRNAVFRIDSISKMTATILAPPDSRSLSDEEWLLVLEMGDEIGQELEELGFKVYY